MQDRSGKNGFRHFSIEAERYSAQIEGAVCFGSIRNRHQPVDRCGRQSSRSWLQFRQARRNYGCYAWSGRFQNYRFPNARVEYEVFSSCDPCAVCIGAIHGSGVRRLVRGLVREDAHANGMSEGPVFMES